MAKRYTEADIDRFAGLSGIRKKPTVYVGPMDCSGLWTVLREPADNCVDQALAGRNTSVHLISDPTPNTYWVVDSGEGIPVGMKTFEDERGRKEKLSTLFVVTGLTHGGGNFSGNSISRGTHGIGIKATNALSKKFAVWTFRDGVWYYIEYAEGRLVVDVCKSKRPVLPHNIKCVKGTVIQFQPDLSLFNSKKPKLEDILEWCEMTSYLVPGLHVKYTSSKGRTKQFHTQNGLKDYIDATSARLACKISGKAFIYSSSVIDVGIAFSDAEGACLVKAYTNGLLNAQGGEHLDALHFALVKSLLPYKGKLEYTPTDVREGLVGLINFKLSAPQFNNQTKDKLLDGRVSPVAQPLLLEELGKFWNANKSLAKEVCQRAATLRKRTADFLKDKKLIKSVASAHKGLSAKFADCARGTARNKCELYLVEGDSAGGTAKVARHREFQATFSMKGKPLNVTDCSKERVNANKEIAGIFASIGVNFSLDQPSSKLNFDKFIFLADPDVDGFHINVLLMALFWKYLPELYAQGRMYVLLSPEYMAKHKNKVYVGSSAGDIHRQCGTTKVDVRHIKGWGELDPEDMQPIAFDTTTRRLLRLSAPPGAVEASQFYSLMGKKALYRQQLLGVETSGVDSDTEEQNEK